ncbi:MAG: hypothetical protein GXP55_13885 [Deltaproteobacteria bacterium]|nr:hypothetical protein [Deltaproteobacteria bacterium]
MTSLPLVFRFVFVAAFFALALVAGFALLHLPALENSDLRLQAAPEAESDAAAPWGSATGGSPLRAATGAATAAPPSIWLTTEGLELEHSPPVTTLEAMRAALELRPDNANALDGFGPRVGLDARVPPPLLRHFVEAATQAHLESVFLVARSRLGSDTPYREVRVVVGSPVVNGSLESQGWRWSADVGARTARALRSRTGETRILNPSFDPSFDEWEGGYAELRLTSSSTSAALFETAAHLEANQMDPVLRPDTEPETFEALLQRTRSENVRRSTGAALTLTQLMLDADHVRRAREALERVYAAARSSEVRARWKYVGVCERLIRAALALYDPESRPFLLALASDASELGSLRVAAANAYALLAGRAAATSLRAMIRAEPENTVALFSRLDVVLTVAEECDLDLPCWFTKLDTPPAGHVSVAAKAAYMVGVLGPGSSEALAALVAHLDSPDRLASLASLRAIDHLAVEGSPEAVARINSTSWPPFTVEAQRVRARLIARSH